MNFSYIIRVKNHPEYALMPDGMYRHMGFNDPKIFTSRGDAYTYVLRSYDPDKFEVVRFER